MQTTRTIHWENCYNPASAGPRGPANNLARYVYLVTRAIGAFTAGFTLLAVYTWAATQAGMASYIQAFTWSASFVFFALALDSHSSSTSLLSLATGIVIAMIAVLSVHMGAGITILSALLMSAWLVTAIYKR